jgi:antitoxin component of RelBE/YafQ-DinJ toxin-antitoxin module
MKKQVNIRMDEELIEKAKELGKSQNRSLSNLIVHLLHEACQTEESEVDRMSRNPELIRLARQAEKEFENGETLRLDPDKPIWDQF